MQKKNYKVKKKSFFTVSVLIAWTQWIPAYKAWKNMGDQNSVCDQIGNRKIAHADKQVDDIVLI